MVLLCERRCCCRVAARAAIVSSAGVLDWPVPTELHHHNAALRKVSNGRRIP